MRCIIPVRKHLAMHERQCLPRHHFSSVRWGVSGRDDGVNAPILHIMTRACTITDRRRAVHHPHTKFAPPQTESAGWQTQNQRVADARYDKAPRK